MLRHNYFNVGDLIKRGVQINLPGRGTNKLYKGRVCAIQYINQKWFTPFNLTKNGCMVGVP